MAERPKVYKCTECGNIVEVLQGGADELVYWGKPMENLAAKTPDEGKEKHVPVIENIDGGINVKVGSVPHPVEAENYIEWIGVFAHGKAYRQFLNPGGAPEAEFAVVASQISASQNRNKQGMLKGE